MDAPAAPVVSGAPGSAAVRGETVRDPPRGLPRRPARLPSLSPRVAVLLVGAVVLGTALWIGRDILAPFVVGLLLVFLLDPLVERLARASVGDRRMPRWLVILLVYLVAGIVLVELLLLLVGPLVEQVRAFVDAAPGYLQSLNQRFAEAFAWWRRLDVPADVRATVDKAIGDLVTNLGSIAPAVVQPVFSSLIGLIGSIFGYVIVPVWVFWILKDRPTLVQAFDRALPVEWRDDAWAALGIVRRVFGSWIRAQLILGLVVGIATFAGLLVLGIAVDPVFRQYAILLSVIAGLLELLPIVGPIISAVPAVLVGATAGVPGIVATLVLYFAVQQVENNLLVPKIQGDATNLHAAVVIFALILGGAIAGLLGAILALPVAATARDLYVYAFRRAGGQSPMLAATGDARAAQDMRPDGADIRPAGAIEPTSAGADAAPVSGAAVGGVPPAGRPGAAGAVKAAGVDASSGSWADSGLPADSAGDVPAPALAAAPAPDPPLRANQAS